MMIGDETERLQGVGQRGMEVLLFVIIVVMIVIDLFVNIVIIVIIVLIVTITIIVLVVLIVMIVIVIPPHQTTGDEMAILAEAGRAMKTQGKLCIRIFICISIFLCTLCNLYGIESVRGRKSKEDTKCPSYYFIRKALLL